MIKVYSGLKGFTFFLFIIAGVVLFISVLFWGIAKAAEMLLPLLIVLSYLLIVIFLFGIFLAAFIKELRPSLSRYSVSMSSVLGLTTWMMSFFFVIKTFGGWGIFFALLFQFLAPIAIAGAILKGAWDIAGHLFLWIGFSYGMKFYSQWVLGPGPQEREKGDIIDIDAIEVENHD